MIRVCLQKETKVIRKRNLGENGHISEGRRKGNVLQWKHN